MGGKIKVVIGGVNGKMGRASVAAIAGDPDLELVGAFGKTGSAYAGKRLADWLGGQTAAGALDSGLVVHESFADTLSSCRADVYLDFTEAEPAIAHAKLAISRGIHPVIGTSGLKDGDIAELTRLADSSKTGAMIVPNFSLGAVLMMEFSRMAGKLYSNVEVVEMHHTGKTDAPSGTAMHTLRKLAADGRKFNQAQVKERELVTGARGGANGSGARVHSLRLPGLISHQEVIFGAEGELLTIRHDSYNTNCFLPGILMSLKAVSRMEGMVVGLEGLLSLNGNT